MELPRLAPPLPADAELRRTHLSEVWLTEDRAIKVQRPVDVGFVDHTRREARLAACEAEVRLNRRMAPDVYLGVVALADGEPAVEMRRLRDEDSLLARLEAGHLDERLVRAVGARIAAFHADTASSAEIAEYGLFDAVRANAIDNYAAAEGSVGQALSARVHAAGLAATEATLTRLRKVIDGRARTGRVRDTHGDLRLEHVYVEAAGAGAGEGTEPVVRVIDCVAFADRFRYADVAADIAFLAMDLEVRSRRDLAAALIDAWVEATGDDDALEVIPFYVAYRSAVRGKVAGITLGDPSLAPERRALQLARARRHWLFAWHTLAQPRERPILVGVGGRPGTGKTTVARGLADAAGFTVIRSDVVRKELAGLPPDASARAAPDTGLYTEDRRDAVYDACFARAADALFAGDRVIVDASFTRARWRRRLAELAAAWGVPALILRCEAPDDVVRSRLATRVADASDADVQVYDHLTWQADAPGDSGGAGAEPQEARIDTSDAIGDTVKRALQAIPADHR